MAHRKRIQIGPYTVGEIALPLEVSFVDFSGVAVDLTGYSADMVIEKIDAPLATDANLGQGVAAIVAPETGGVVRYTWDEADFANPGRYQAQMWVGNGARRIASVELWYDVVDVTAAPNI
jgi:hypothetical protein